VSVPSSWTYPSIRTFKLPRAIRPGREEVEDGEEAGREDGEEGEGEEGRERASSS
jgi:hypothetical protein